VRRRKIRRGSLITRRKYDVTEVVQIRQEVDGAGENHCILRFAAFPVVVY